MKALWVIGIVVLLSSGNAFAAEFDDAFFKANAAFEDGAYDEAAAIYRELAEKKGAVSEDLFFNLGNALFRDGKPGEAALWFQRARVFDPRMPEANQNLQYLQKLHGYLNIERTPLEDFLFKLKPSEFTFLTSLGVWVFLIALAATIVIQRLRDWRPLLIIVSIFGLVLAIASFWAGRIRSERLASEHFAIVTAEDVSALTAPAPGSESVIALPPGSEVRIVQNRGPWKYVDIPGNLRGWVDADVVEEIWPIGEAE